MESRILNLLGRKDYVPASSPDLRSALRLSPDKRKQLQRTLKSLEQSGQIARIKGDRWVIPTDADLVPGRIQITRSGRGFLVPDTPGLGEIEVPASETGTALHGDHVLVRRKAGVRTRPEESTSGSVVRVLERSRSRFVGTLKHHRQFLSVEPDDPRFRHEIIVPPARDVGTVARAGDKVVVELTEWESRQSAPEGIITEVLGPATAEGVDMLSILRQYDLPLKFPPKVLQEAKTIGTVVQARDLRDRTDCRDHLVVTIDPETAKDFDDAFCLTRINDRRWKLWVHIADVSHYVKPGSALDQEARRRGNSTYLVDRVIPMLPEALSNELCSLKPKVDRLTKCVEFLLSDAGEVLRTRCYPAVIHSRHRYSYEEAMAVIAQENGDSDLERMIVDADRLAQNIRQRRYKAGSLELDFQETKINLDENGDVASIEKVDNDQSHQLIEEFMLLANEAVATRLLKLGRPSIHRVHEKPDPARLADYREEVLSHNITCGNLEKPVEVQRLLRRLNDLTIGPALKIGFLKSLMRARYATEALGHYGLAKAKYAHFTSPIRRYADLIVHRSLFEKAKIPKSELRQISDHISATERNSSDAERDSKSVKLYAFLKSQLRRRKRPSYTGMVTDVRNFGFFVDVSDLGMSGLVPLSILKDDFYEFDSARHQVRGRRHRRIIKLGDLIEVEVAKVDDSKKQVDFTLASTDPSSPSESKGRSNSNRNRRPQQKRARSSATPTSGQPAKQANKRSRRRKAPNSSSSQTRNPKRKNTRRR